MYARTHKIQARTHYINSFDQVAINLMPRRWVRFGFDRAPGAARLPSELPARAMRRDRTIDGEAVLTFLPPD